MRMSEALNLVLPIGDLHAHHTPISREVFEANYRMLAATRAALSGKGVIYQMMAGPRIAKLALLDEARSDAEERGEFELDSTGKPLTNDGRPVPSLSRAQALLGEIQRLTVILCPGAKGWDALPVDAAIRAGHVDEEDWAEAQARLVFFTCICSMESRAERAGIAQATASLMKASITSLPPLEYAASSLGSTKVAPSTAAGFVVPS